MNLTIAYEDDQLLVVDKPSGLTVNKSETTKEETLQDIVADYINISPISLGGRAGIVHRLDKPTSGLIIIAKNEQALEALQAQFKAREVNKKYRTLVHGLIKPETGRIDAPILRNPFNRQQFGVFLGGRTAETEYGLEGYYQGNNEQYSYLSVYPRTGRTHQIRVHLKYLGYPVVGDDLYGGRKQIRKDRQWCPRLFLHAYEISFFHPINKQQITVKSNLSPDLVAAMENLKKIN